MTEHVQGLETGWVARTGYAPHAEGMSDKPPRREATYEDLERVPPSSVAELIGGELYVSPRPRTVHSLAATQLVAALVSMQVEPKGSSLGGWVFLVEPELHFGRDALVPDIAGWRRERMPELPDVAALTLAPDWVCEVLSPSTEVLDRARKMDVYAREGVRHLWLVDPRPQMLEIHRCEASRWSRLGVHVGDVTVRAEPFEALDLPLNRLWQR